MTSGQYHFSQVEQEIARNAIRKLDVSLEPEFLLLMDYLHKNPERTIDFRGKTPPKFPSKEYTDKLAEKFVAGRKLPRVQWSTKTSDPLLASALKTLLEIEQTKIDDAIEIHKKLMIIENKIGEILESYISEKYSSKGWVWCSGSTVKTVDFIRKQNDGIYEVLQIKNKDVSENSTSTKGRAGIPIWKRLKGKRATDNWEKFPGNELDRIMSEAEFVEYAENKFKEIKAAQKDE
jgi:hypothetical protein